MTEAEVWELGRFRRRAENPSQQSLPELQEEARERLAVNQYLQQLDHPLAAFGVKQKHPQTIDEAVSATLEMETYVTP